MLIGDVLEILAGELRSSHATNGFSNAVNECLLLRLEVSVEGGIDVAHESNVVVLFVHVILVLFQCDSRASVISAAQ